MQEKYEDADMKVHSREELLRISLLGETAENSYLYLLTIPLLNRF